MNRRTLLNTLCILVAMFVQNHRSHAQDSSSIQHWNQWGGAGRTFEAVVREELLQNPPKLLWEKNIGTGHSAIVADGEYAYCQFYNDYKEIVERYQLTTGECDWRFSFPVSYEPGNRYPGPHPTPLLIKRKLVLASSDAQILVVDIETASLDWKVNLCERFQTKLPQSGYASSPLVKDGIVIVPTLGESQQTETERYRPTKRIGSVPGMVGLSLENGKTVWKSESFRGSHASPLAVDIEKQPTIVFHGMFQLVGLNPSNGRVLWKQKLRDVASDNVSFSPIWDKANGQFLLTHGYCDKGAQAISVSRNENGWKTQTRWQNRDLGVVHTNGILRNDLLVGTKHSQATLAVGIDIERGETVFRKRFRKSNFICSERTTLVLDEDGTLKCGTIDRSGFNERWKVEILSAPAWTAPSLDGQYLLVRDRAKMKVFRFD